MDGELRRISRLAVTEDTDASYARLGRAFLRSQAGDEPYRMRLTTLGANRAELETRAHRILMSYGVPVAFQVKDGGCFYRTDKSHSRTTTKHINGWLGDAKSEARVTPQAIVDGLLDS